MPFEFQQLRIPGLVLITPRRFSDERGFFLETYSRAAFEANGIPSAFVQNNMSFSRKDVLRGLHFQRPPMAQAKLVQVVSGAIFDVAVDIDPRSATYGEWEGVRLSSETLQLFYIPDTFAHGFCVLSDTAVVTYAVSADYSPKHEGGLRWDDPALGISWPVAAPLLSPRDLEWPAFPVGAGPASPSFGGDRQ